MTQDITLDEYIMQPSHYMHSNYKNCTNVVTNHKSVESIWQDTSYSKKNTCNIIDLLNDETCSGRSKNSQYVDKELHIPRNFPRCDAIFLNKSLHTIQLLANEIFVKESMINCAEVLLIYSDTQYASMIVKNDWNFL